MQPVKFPLQTATCERRQRPQVMDTRASKSNLIVAETDGVYMPDLSESAYIPTDLNWRVLTPAQAAREIARANGHLSPALIIVRSWTPKGSEGRRGWAHKHATFVSVDGKANPLKVRRQGAEIAHNGGCQMCGQVYAEYSLKWAEAPDGWLKACPACVDDGQLHTDNVVSPFLFVGLQPRPMPSRMVRPAEYAYRIFVDLTKGGAVEVGSYAEHRVVHEGIESGIQVLRAWVREHSRDAATFDEFVLVMALLHDDHSPLAVLRQDLQRVSYLVQTLGDYERFTDLMQTVKRLTGGER